MQKMMLVAVVMVVALVATAQPLQSTQIPYASHLLVGGEFVNLTQPLPLPGSIYDKVSCEADGCYWWPLSGGRGFCDCF